MGDGLRSLLRKSAYRKPAETVIIPTRAAERAATRFEKNENGCHISTYSRGSHGYAQIGWQEGASRHVTTAHRAAWVHANGRQIPTGMTVDHLCKERACVNPDHLRLLSNFDNARRTDGRDWPLGECANGHPDSRLVLTTRGGGSRRWICRDCRAEYQRRHRKKKRALLLHQDLIDATGAAR